MTLRKQQYAEIVAKAVASKGGATFEARKKVYEQLITANDRINVKLPPEVAADMRDELRERIAVHEALFGDAANEWRNEGRPNTSERRVGRGGSATLGFMFGVFCAGIIAFLLIDQSGAKQYDPLALDVRIAALQPKVDQAERFLQSAREYVERQMLEDPDGLEAKAGRDYVLFSDIAPPELMKRAPEIPGADLLVLVADGGYKILYLSALCTAVQLVRPVLVDPTRTVFPLGCTHFGYWNEAGAQL
jgi:hypothetical protein